MGAADGTLSCRGLKSVDQLAPREVADVFEAGQRGADSEPSEVARPDSNLRLFADPARRDAFSPEIDDGTSVETGAWPFRPLTGRLVLRLRNHTHSLYDGSRSALCAPPPLWGSHFRPVTWTFHRVEVKGLEPSPSALRMSGSQCFDQVLSEDFPGSGVSIASGSLTIPLFPSR